MALVLNKPDSFLNIKAPKVSKNSVIFAFAAGDDDLAGLNKDLAAEERAVHWVLLLDILFDIISIGRVEDLVPIGPHDVEDPEVSEDLALVADASEHNQVVVIAEQLEAVPRLGNQMRLRCYLHPLVLAV